jgi:hypothetical protein
VVDEWEVVRSELRTAGVDGVDDLGRFVNNTAYFAPSRLDEEAATPVLLRLLPALTQPRVVTTVARHLQRPSLRRVAGAYDVVRGAYLHWAASPGEVGWVLGDTLCRAADQTRGADLIELADRPDHGASRGCIVESLWRFKKNVPVEATLRRLIADPDVVLPALSSLQRTVGPGAMVSILEDLLRFEQDPAIQRAASRQLRRVRRSLGTG